MSRKANVTMSIIEPPNADPKEIRGVTCVSIRTGDGWIRHWFKEQVSLSEAQEVGNQMLAEAGLTQGMPLDDYNRK